MDINRVKLATKRAKRNLEEVWNMIKTTPFSQLQDRWIDLSRALKKFEEELDVVEKKQRR